jgi:hypothetical protein
MLLRYSIAVYCDSQMQHMKMVCGQYAGSVMLRHVVCAVRAVLEMLNYG